MSVMIRAVSGALFVAAGCSNTWDLEATLTPTPGHTTHGRAVAIDGDLARARPPR